MSRMIKYLWIFLSIFAILGLLSIIPLEKYQKSYIKEINRTKNIPQRRVNATFKYVEDIQNGELNTNWFSAEPPKKYIIKEQQKESKKRILHQKKYQKPLYIRDKRNFKILYKYKGK